MLDEDSIAAINNENKIISLILRYLDAEELRTARLVSSTFNDIITSNPELLWKKNIMTVQVRTTDADRGAAKEWKMLRAHRLVTDYTCPNYHFVKTNLLSLGSLEFFQSSIRHHVKHLKLTKCRMTSDLLLHIVACCQKSLTHLEIVDFSRMEQSENTLFPDSRKGPSLQSLECLILDNTQGNEDTLNGMTQTLLRNILNGTRRLGQILFHGWGAKSCKKFVEVLGSIFPDHLQQLEQLEIVCSSEENLSTVQQYSFIKFLESLCIPKMRKFVLRFDRPVEPSIGLTETLINDLTESVATMLEEASENLEVIELINCPLSNAILRKGANSFPKLEKINTRGTLVWKVDEDANPLYEFNLKSRTTFRRRVLKNGPTRRITTATLTPTLGMTEGQESTSSDDSLPRTEIYKIACAAILCCGLVHFGMRSFIDSYIADKFEVLIYAVVTLWIMKGSEIRQTWESMQTSSVDQ